MICEHCKNIYYDKSTLLKHQKTSKFCIKIQTEKNENIIINKFICNFCNKELSTKQSLNRHINICKLKKNNEDNEIKKLLNELHNEIKDIKKSNIINK